MTECVKKQPKIQLTLWYEVLVFRIEYNIYVKAIYIIFT